MNFRKLKTKNRFPKNKIRNRYYFQKRIGDSGISKPIWNFRIDFENDIEQNQKFLKSKKNETWFWKQPKPILFLKTKPNPEIWNKKLVSTFTIDFKSQHLKISQSKKGKTLFSKFRNRHIWKIAIWNIQKRFRKYWLWKFSETKNRKYFFWKNKPSFWKTKSKTEIQHFHEPTTENKFWKSDFPKTFLKFQIRNRFSKSESDIEIQNFLNPKIENQFPQFDFLKKTP